jgi:hypothetical protein
MDSGISSAPPQRPSPPEPEPENQAHGDLDKLLHDMMLTVEVKIVYRLPMIQNKPIYVGN